MTASAWSPNPSTVEQVNVRGNVVQEPQTATAGQLTFNLLTFAYAPNTGSIVVFKNGDVLRKIDDFTEVGASQIQLKVACVAGDKLLFVGFVGTTSTTNADPVLRADLAAANGASIVQYNASITIQQALDILYYGVKSPMHPQYAGGAKGDGVTNDYAALSACYADNNSPFVSIPANKTFFTNSAVAVPSGTVTNSAGGKILGSGTTDLFHLAYPSNGTTFNGLILDGNKLSGTPDVVTLIYAPGSINTPDNKSKNLRVLNCILRNGSAGVAFENSLYCNVHDNQIESMFRHTSGPAAGSYGYGIVYNGVQNSIIHNNIIGSVDGPIERHGIYMPVFLDSQAAPTVLNFASSINITGNRISVKHDPANEPYSSCIEAWNYFDILIEANQLVGGVRGINATPEYQNGSRVMIIGNLIKDSEICIRNDRATKGVAPGTYYFAEYLIENNEIVPLTSKPDHQGIFLQGVKKITTNGNNVRGSASTSFAIGYYDVAYNNIVCEVFTSNGNTIAGFAQGFYLANITKFDDNSSFQQFTGAVIPYVRNANIGSSEMSPKLSPATSLYAFTGPNWAGTSYYEPELEKIIRNNGTFWVDQNNLRVRGPTANRPSNVSNGNAANGLHAGLPYGFRYHDDDAGVLVYWNTICWATSQQPVPPLADTTANLNTFKANYPTALSYGAHSWNTTTSKPVFFNAATVNWVYADGTPI